MITKTMVIQFNPNGKQVWRTFSSNEAQVKPLFKEWHILHTCNICSDLEYAVRLERKTV